MNQSKQQKVANTYQKFQHLIYTFDEEYPLQSLKYINQTIIKSKNPEFLTILIESGLHHQLTNLTIKNQLNFNNLFYGYVKTNVKQLSKHVPVVLCLMIKQFCGVINNIDDILQMSCVKTLSYISAGNSVQTKNLIRCERIVKTLIHKLTEETTIHVKLRVMFTISNMLADSPEYIRLQLLSIIPFENLINILYILVHHGNLKYNSKQLSLMKAEVITLCSNLDLGEEFKYCSNVIKQNTINLLSLLTKCDDLDVQRYFIFMIYQLTTDSYFLDSLFESQLIMECFIFLKKNLNKLSFFNEKYKKTAFYAISAICCIFEPDGFLLDQNMALTLANKSLLKLLLNIVVSKQFRWMLTKTLEIFQLMTNNHELLLILLNNNVIKTLTEELKEHKHHDAIDKYHFNQIINVICSVIISLNDNQQFTLLNDYFAKNYLFDALIKALLSSSTSEQNREIIVQSIGMITKNMGVDVEFCLKSI